MTTNTTNSQAASILPFGFVVACTLHSLTTGHSYIMKRRIFTSEHDAKHCHKQWLEQMADYISRPSNGMEWKITQHEVYEDIDAKLAQAREEGFEDGLKAPDSAYLQIVERTKKAESRLAEIQRGVEALTRYEFRTGFRIDIPAAGILPDVLCSYVMFEAVEGLLAPQGQASTCEHNIVSAVNQIVKSGMLCTKCGKLFHDDGTPIQSDTSGLPG